MAAQPPLFEARLGTASLVAAVRDRPSPILEVRGSGAAVRAPWPIGAPTAGSFEAVPVAPGATVGHLSATDAQGRRAEALVGLVRNRAKILWIARTDLRGDPGERSGDALRLAEPSSTGERAARIGIVSDTHRTCDDTSMLLRPRRLDPVTMAWAPEALPLPNPDQVEEILATPTSPGPRRTPRLVALVPRAATSIAGHRDGLPPRPFALADGDPGTAWAAGDPSARGETAILRFPAAPLPIRAFGIIPFPAGAALPFATQAPRRIWLIGDRGPALRIEIPLDVEPGQRLWVRPREAVTWSCVSIVFDDPPDTTALAPQAIAEIEAYTDVDFDGGLARLVSALDGAPAAAREATRWLGTLGAEAIGAIGERLPTLGPTGRRRAMRALGDLAKRHASAAEALAASIRETDDDEVIEEAVDDLVAAGAPASSAVRALVLAAGAAGDRAARELARRRPDEAIPVLLDAIVETGGTDRRAVREALTLAERGAPDGALTALEALRARAPSADVAAAVALATATAGDALRDEARAFYALARDAEDFVPRYRAIRAARELGPDPAIDAWLETVVARGEPWMLRAEALEAARERDSAAARALAASAIEDAYPRVRAIAVAILGDTPTALARVAWLARRDPWPLVRAIAVTEIVDVAEGRPVVRAAVTDRAPRVRAAALQALLPYASEDVAWDSARRRLELPREARGVLLAGIRLARARCRDDVIATLGELVRRGAGHAADDDEIEVALAAVDALGRLGTPAARDVLEHVRTTASEPAVHQAAARSLAAEARCRPDGAARTEASGP